MMALWPTTLRVDNQELKLLVTSSADDDLLKARLPIQARHPRALLTLLEGVALWSGQPLYVVISAGRHREDWLGSEQWGDQLWPDESALVQFELGAPRSRPRRILHGIGDFRELRRQLPLLSLAGK
jgi:hypothetical protein